jgi:hypothetical protein
VPLNSSLLFNHDDMTPRDIRVILNVAPRMKLGCGYVCYMLKLNKYMLTLHDYHKMYIKYVYDVILLRKNLSIDHIHVNI